MLIFFSCDEGGGGGSVNDKNVSDLLNQPNFGDANGGQNIQQQQNQNGNGSGDPQSMFGDASQRATMLQCDQKSLVWVAVNDQAGGMATCGQSFADYGCCIESITARFGTFANQASQYHNQKIKDGYELYACETGSNNQQRFHYAKPGSAKNSINYQFMNFSLKAQNVTKEFQNCPKRLTPSKKLMAAIRRYQTPHSFDKDKSSSIPDPDSPGDLTQEEEEDRTVYPVYYQNAGGVMTHRKGRVNVVAKVEMASNKTSFYFKQSGTRAVSGDHTGKVNDKIGASNGKREGVRAPKTAVDNTEANNLDFINTNFIIYADSMKTQSGKEYFFQPHAPGVIVPAAQSRYDVFFGFPTLEYNTKVTGHKTFDLKTTITRIENSPTKVVLKIINKINDPSGRIYQDFPLPAQLEYTIDPKRKIITAIKTTEYYYDAEGGGSKRYTTTTNAKTCKIVTGDRTTDIDC